LSDHPVHHSIIRGGPYAGKSLRELMEHHRQALLGTAAPRYERFPWLVKFLDAADWLSVQVHPDEKTVSRWLPGEGSKTEAWFVIDAAPGSRIYAGLLPGVDQDRLLHALRQGTVAECLHSFEPRPGDCVFLPAGTVHAIGGGVLLAEVQQTSDATFRLFDWNRVDSQGKSRQLHIEESLASIHWDQGPVQPRRVPLSSASEAHRRWPLVECPHFVLEYVEASRPVAWGGSGRLQVLIVLDGAGQVETGPGPYSIARGEVLLLPAAMPQVRCSPAPRLRGLLCTLP
ncbi:MAG TPA: type I phosphomannose isomerase catalytic subunit, partial [Gemmataceae bacterium]|nr:type I phosphomannose isomerase catalytic subunit [Gemmataceae bacterium]